ncbi:allene oxide cyclase barrel-like domain-containing protein [Nocardia gamkensis]|uniref:allene oxide cyclase barrel-like domain-containing protein n=1 Tax=Nocardia gamkensis TaxID=352869 RepID=UPI0037C6AEC7
MANRMQGGAIAVVAAAVVTGPAAASAAAEVIELTAIETSSSFFDRDGDKRLGPGDQVTHIDDLRRDEAGFGRGSGVCTVVSIVENASAQMRCDGALSLPEGRITTKGTVTRTPGASAYDIAITGGTGKYTAARGYVHVEVVAADRTQLTLHLT